MVSTTVIFLLVFGAFGWYLYKAFRLTRNTVGKDSPLYVQRTYHVSAWEYFTGLNMAVNYMFYLLSPMWLILLFRVNWSAPKDIPLLQMGMLLLFFGITCLVFLASFKLLTIDRNYWEHTRNKTLVFDPTDYSLTVVTPEQTWHIRQVDILAIENYYGSRPYTNYEYYRLKLVDEDEVILTNRSKGLWALSEYFKNIPHHSHRQHYPIIQ